MNEGNRTAAVRSRSRRRLLAACAALPLAGVLMMPDARAQAASRKLTPSGTATTSRAGMLTRSRAKPST